MQDCLYAVKSNESFTRYRFSNNLIEPTDLLPQPTKKIWAGIANFEDHAIFLIGGKVDDEDSNSCGYYLILKDQWYEAPSLNKARYWNNSCSLGRYVYTFEESIERLDAKSLLEGLAVTWTPI